MSPPLELGLAALAFRPAGFALPSRYTPFATVLFPIPASVLRATFSACRQGVAYCRAPASTPSLAHRDNCPRRSSTLATDMTKRPVPSPCRSCSSSHSSPCGSLLTDFAIILPACSAGTVSGPFRARRTHALQGLCFGFAALLVYSSPCDLKHRLAAFEGSFGR